MDRQWRHLGFFSVVLGLMFAVALFSVAASDDERELVERLRQQFKIPSAYILKLGPPENTEIPSLVKRTLEVSGGPKPRVETIYLSEDGQYLFWGRVYDLNAQANLSRFQNIPVEGHPMRGPADAKITIIEYSDFQCPFCERAYWTVKYKILRRFGGQVRFVFKDFPLTRSHPWALKAAVAAQCAFDQGNEAFWRMHDLIFEHQDEITAESISVKVVEFAGEAKIDLERFTRCYEAESPLPRIRSSLAEATSLGLTGTPAFIVNGQPLSGAVPFSALKAVIEAELDKRPARVTQGDP